MRADAPARVDSVALPGGGALDLRAPRVMGILNVTPDSFSDGGRHFELSDALAGARAMAAAGAAILDVGGESTRPGAEPVPAAEERRRVVPLVEALAELDLPISIDTRKAEVAGAALRAGAALVNDVTGLADPDMAAVTAEHGAALCVGHIQGEPATMQRDPRYDDVVSAVYESLARACERAVAAGVASEALLVDPGIGFGKRLEHNLALLANLERFRSLAPVVIGVSRKRMLSELLEGRPVEGRLAGGLGAALAAVRNGARVVRTHDVGETVDALRVAWAIERAAGGAP